MHIPVLLNEVIEQLRMKSGDNVIDGTVGGGGHAKALLEATAPDGHILALDRDATALEVSRRTLGAAANRVTFVHDSFANLKSIYDQYFRNYPIHGILLDLGLSSNELDSPDRGFSFRLDAPLDMRFDTRQSLTAADIINTWPAERLQKVLREYGNELLAPEIIRAVLDLRQQKQKIQTTKQLVDVILSVYRMKLKSKKEIPWVGGHHPATKVFQALRIAVNDEFTALEAVLPQAINLLQPGGRLAVIAFHSAEDRIVKQMFREAARDCICPPEAPVCVCNHIASVRLITKKPITPHQAEISQNPRSRSATLRVAEKIQPALTT